MNLPSIKRSGRLKPGPQLQPKYQCSPETYLDLTDCRIYREAGYVVHHNLRLLIGGPQQQAATQGGFILPIFFL